MMPCVSLHSQPDNPFIPEDPMTLFKGLFNEEMTAHMLVIRQGLSPPPPAATSPAYGMSLIAGETTLAASSSEPTPSPDTAPSNTACFWWSSACRKVGSSAASRRTVAEVAVGVVGDNGPPVVLAVTAIPARLKVMRVRLSGLQQPSYSYLIPILLLEEESRTGTHRNGTGGSGSNVWAQICSKFKTRMHKSPRGRKGHHTDLDEWGCAGDKPVPVGSIYTYALPVGSRGEKDPFIKLRQFQIRPFCSVNATRVHKYASKEKQYVAHRTRCSNLRKSKQ